jgi:hypothetical protein
MIVLMRSNIMIMGQRLHIGIITKVCELEIFCELEI